MSGVLSSLLRDKRGWTPLHQAAARGDARMVRTLLQGRGLEVREAGRREAGLKSFLQHMSVET